MAFSPWSNIEPVRTTKSILRKRALAYAVDQVLIWWAHKFIFRMLMLAVLPTFSAFPWRARNMILEHIDGSKTSVYVFTVIAYYIISSWMGEGQTVGQKFFSLKQKINPMKNSSASYELLSYILRGTSIAFFQMLLGVPFFLHFFTKDGQGLQDWISFSSVEAKEKEDQFFVIYGNHVPNHEVINHHQYVFRNAHDNNKEGLQLSLALDFKNPSVAALNSEAKILPFKKAA